MDIVKTLQTALVAQDTSRDRATQVEIGASSIGGCRAQAWHIIHQSPTTNHDTESLAAIIGTAIHATIAEAMKKADIFEDEYEIEFPLSIPGLKGNCDLYVKSEKAIYDWKSVTMKKLESGRWLDRQKKIQVNLYGYMKNQLEPGSVETVGLVAIPRDGKMTDIQVWQEPYNEQLALEGLAWLDEVKSYDTPPAPERPAQIFCAPYCKFYDMTGEVGCPGK